MTDPNDNIDYSNEEISGDSMADETEDLSAVHAEIESLRAEKAALFEKLARVQADFTNARRRLENEGQTRLEYANEGLIKELLPIIDNFERALAQDPAKSDAATLLTGMQLVHDQWMGVLEKYGVSPITPEKGVEFDPSYHQALMQTPDDYPTATVTMLLQKGYKFRDRIIRAAQVAVSRPKD